jgi:hypothetical protein
MRRFALRVLRILAQFIVAGGFTRAIDAWVGPLDPGWQLTVLAITQFVVAMAQAFLEDQGILPPILKAPTSKSLRSDSRHERVSTTSPSKEAN